METKHSHRKHHERGPWGCSGGVAYIHVCSCGAERHTCNCSQCKDQGGNVGEWEMPICEACGLRHRKDKAC